MRVTDDQIADRMGRHRSVVSHILNGRQKMSLDWAEAFADLLDSPIEKILSKAGVRTSSGGSPRPLVGLSESEAVFVGKEDQTQKAQATASLLGGDRPGIDVWIVNATSMMFEGLLPGDQMLVDTHQASNISNSDNVLAQVYDQNIGTATTIIRRYEAPVLVAAGPDRDDKNVYVVDNNNVVIKGKIIAVWRTG